MCQDLGMRNDSTHLPFRHQPRNLFLHTCILFGSISSSGSGGKSPKKRCVIHAVPLQWKRWQTLTEITEMRSRMFGHEALGREFLQCLSFDWSFNFLKTHQGPLSFFIRIHACPVTCLDGYVGHGLEQDIDVFRQVRVGFL